MKGKLAPKRMIQLLLRVRRGTARLNECLRIALYLPPYSASYRLIDRQPFELFYREFPHDHEEKEYQTLQKEEAAKLRLELARMIEALARSETHLILTTLPQRQK